MKNIFKENKELKKEIKRLNERIDKLLEENSNTCLEIQRRYQYELEQRSNFLEQKYKTKINVKSDVLEIVKSLKESILGQIHSLVDIDISKDLECYLKLLKFLKEE